MVCQSISLYELGDGGVLFGKIELRIALDSFFTSLVTCQMSPVTCHFNFYLSLSLFYLQFLSFYMPVFSTWHLFTNYLQVTALNWLDKNHKNAKTNPNHNYPYNFVNKPRHISRFEQCMHWHSVLYFLLYKCTRHMHGITYYTLTKQYLAITQFKNERQHKMQQNIHTKKRIRMIYMYNSGMNYHKPLIRI